MTPVAIGVGLMVAASWFVARQVGASPAALARPSGIELAARLVQSLAIAPIVEELAFRGFLARRLTALEFERVEPARISWLALALSSLAFGALHQSVFAAIVAGASYAWLYRRRGSLVDAIVAHAATNAALVAIGLVSGEWELWT